MSLVRTLRRDTRAYAVDVHEGRLERSLSLLSAAGAVVTGLEIWMEHDRASFGNRMMWAPVGLAPLMSAAGIAGFLSRRAAHTVLPLCSALVVANGLQGTWLHARGVAQKPGGWHSGWETARYNAETGPPVFAPLLVTVVGGMGLLAAVLRRERRT